MMVAVILSNNSSISHRWLLTILTTNYRRLLMILEIILILTNIHIPDRWLYLFLWILGIVLTNSDWRLRLLMVRNVDSVRTNWYVSNWWSRTISYLWLWFMFYTLIYYSWLLNWYCLLWILDNFGSMVTIAHLMWIVADLFYIHILIHLTAVLYLSIIFLYIVLAN